jgi:uncharacterized damage-inducible protein DinB
MKTDTLTTIYRHNLWANQVLFELCAELTEEQLSTTVQGTYGTIFDTLKHISLAEQGYFSRISTGERYQRAEDAPELTFKTMLESIHFTGNGFIEWSHKVGKEDFVTVDWDGTPRDIPKTIILTQVINHATEHRAQIMVTLTQLGIEPPELDAWMYFDIDSEA